MDSEELTLSRRRLRRRLLDALDTRQGRILHAPADSAAPELLGEICQTLQWDGWKVHSVDPAGPPRYGEVLPELRGRVRADDSPELVSAAVRRVLEARPLRLVTLRRGGPHLRQWLELLRGLSRDQRDPHHLRDGAGLAWLALVDRNEALIEGLQPFRVAWDPLPAGELEEQWRRLSGLAEGESLEEDWCCWTAVDLCGGCENRLKALFEAERLPLTRANAGPHCRGRAWSRLVLAEQALVQRAEAEARRRFDSLDVALAACPAGNGERFANLQQEIDHYRAQQRDDDAEGIGLYAAQQLAQLLGLETLVDRLWRLRQLRNRLAHHRPFGQRELQQLTSLCP